MRRKHFPGFVGVLILTANAYSAAITYAPESRTFDLPAGGTITSSGRINQHTSYFVGAVPWEVNAVPFPLTSTTGADFDAFNNLMHTQFSDWTVGQDTLSDFGNTFVVHTYDAHTVDVRAGAELQVDFVTDDLALIGAPLHWVQVITTDTPGVGRPTPRFDNLFSPRDADHPNGQTPFLDDGYALAGPDFFYDFPKRHYDVENTWRASLFLVQGSNSPGGTGLTVLGGLDWGFENHCDKPSNNGLSVGGTCSLCGCSATPEPATFSLLGVAVLIMSIRGKFVLSTVLHRSRR
jgi:hypothetical protein